MSRLFLSAEEAASVFGTSHQTIRNWAREGRLNKADFERPFRVTMESVSRVSGVSVDDINTFLNTEEERRRKARQQMLVAA